MKLERLLDLMKSLADRDGNVNPIAAIQAVTDATKAATGPELSSLWETEPDHQPVLYGNAVPAHVDAALIDLVMSLTGAKQLEAASALEDWKAQLRGSSLGIPPVAPIPSVAMHDPGWSVPSAGKDPEEAPGDPITIDLRAPVSAAEADMQAFQGTTRKPPAVPSYQAPTRMLGVPAPVPEGQIPDATHIEAILSLAGRRPAEYKRKLWDEWMRQDWSDLEPARWYKGECMHQNTIDDDDDCYWFCMDCGTEGFGP